MVDIVEVSAIVTAVGVLSGVIYYILDMRRQTEIKTIDLMLRLDAILETKDFTEWWATFQERDVKEYETYCKENQKKWIPEKQILGFFTTLSFLVRKKLVDLELVNHLIPILHSWEKLQFYVEKVRRVQNVPTAYASVDYLVNEMKKREKVGVKSG